MQIFKIVFLKDDCFTQMSLQFVPKAPIDKSALD